VKRILVIQTAFLGDVILATPVLSELKRLFPSAQLDMLVKKGNESLLLNNPHLHELHVLNKSNGKWKAIFGLIKEFRKNEYDLVINLHRFGSSGLITAFSGGKKKYGFRKNPFSFMYSKRFKHTIGDGTHEVERNLSVIAEFGAKKRVRPELFPSEKDQVAIQEYIKEEFYCIAPASVWFTKQLPAEKWIELIQTFDAKATVYVLGAPIDKELGDLIIKQANHSGVVNLAGKLSLLQSAALMKQAKRSYVNDSGPLHLASSMNASVTAFFCSTVPDFGFGPLSDDSEIKQVTGLDCRPCGIHGHKACPKGHFNCAKIEL
jgi:ADP-heptose:LPS heptosyltransferase